MIKLKKKGKKKLPHIQRKSQVAPPYRYKTFRIKFKCKDCDIELNGEHAILTTAKHISHICANGKQIDTKITPEMIIPRPADPKKYKTK